MTALDLFSPRPVLPPALMDSLRGVIRRQRTIARVTSAVQIAAVALLILLASSILLGFVALPKWVRLPIAGLAWLSIFYFSTQFIRRALGHWSLSRAAKQVETVVPGLQERLSSAVELMVEEPNAAFRGSPQLLVRLVSQIEHLAARIDPRTVVSTQRLLRQTTLLMPLCIAWVVLATNPHTSLAIRRGIFHTFAPWQSHLPANLANLVVTPGDVVVAEGDAMVVSVTTASRLGAPGNATLIREFPGGQHLSQPMQTGKPGEFQLPLDEVRLGFSYQVRTDSADSDWYSVIVHPRPTVAQLDVHYKYPGYSGLPPRDELSGEGEIRALAGTRVTLSLHTTAPLVASKSAIEIGQGTENAESVSLSELAPLQYQAHFIVNRSGTYRIRLRNAYDLGNKDVQPRPIIAVFDQSPSIVIAAPQGVVTVPPDDVVPVDYLASDDFSVASLRAIVAVDDKPKQVIALLTPAGGSRSVKGTWPIDVKKLLAAAGAKSGSRITYQLQATDNRDPDPQTANSVEQVLIVDAGQTRSYADQMNEQRKRRLEDAIRKALERLRQADWRRSNLKNADDRHILNSDERRDAGELRELLVSASGDLSTSAEEFLNTPYSTVAREAKDIAEHPIAGAAEDIAKAQFAADLPPQRQQSAAHAQIQIADAARRLEKLLPAAEQAQRQAEAMEALRQAAKKQRETADAMANDPQNVDQNRRAQQQAMDKLNDAMNKDPALRNEQARDLAQKLAELTQKIEDDQARQTSLHEVSGHQMEANGAKETGLDIANAQAELNLKIEQFESDQKDRLKQTASNPPRKEDQARIIDWLKKGEIPHAVDAMKLTSSLLNDVARRLADASKREPAATEQSALTQTADAARALASEQLELEKAAAIAARRLDEAKKGLPPDDQVLRQQRELAAQLSALRDAARQLAERGGQQRSAILSRRAEEAGKSLDAAAQSQQTAAEAESRDKPADAAAAQDKAQEALAKADDALRGESQSTQSPEAQGQPGKDGQQSAQASQDANDSQPGTEAGNSSDAKNGQAGDAAQQAAQAAQEASAAQQQAMRPNAAAARQAANALARAQAAARAAQNQRDSAKSSGEDRSAQQAADAGPESAAAQEADAKDGPSAGSRSGIRGENTGASNTPPAAVRDLGISAGDWAKLPPLLQRELMNASQQTGPPAYREMIRNYYIRIAKIESRERQ